MKISKKIIAPICAVLSISLVCVGLTFALLKNSSNAVTNTFTNGTVGNKIEEDITSTPGVKKDVKVTNTGTTDSYVRAIIVASWVDSNGNIYKKAPVAGTDYTIVMPENSDWITVKDYYYCQKAVKAGESSPVLFTSITPVSANTPEGYTFSVEILSSSIQCLPTNAVESAWGVKINTSGLITGKGE